jgi:hypothetical protein
VAQLSTLGIVAMKTAITLLILGLVIGLVVPYYVREIFTGAGIQLRQFWFSKSPPRSFSFSIPMVFRVVGIILVLLAIIRFIFVRASRV